MKKIFVFLLSVGVINCSSAYACVLAGGDTITCAAACAIVLPFAPEAYPECVVGAAPPPLHADHSIRQPAKT